MGTQESRETRGMAVVQIGPSATPYLRMGSGPPVIILTDQATDGERLARVLARSFRVFLPRAKVSQGQVQGESGPVIPLSEWLRGLVDALGLDRPTLVAEPSFAQAGYGFALTDPDRVGHLVTLSDGPPEEAHAMLCRTATGEPLEVALSIVARDPERVLDAALRRGFSGAR